MLSLHELKLKLRVYFAKKYIGIRVYKRYTFRGIWISNISKTMVVSMKDIDKNLFILKVTAHNEFIPESKFFS